MLIKKKKKTNDHLFKSRVCQKYLHSKLSKYKISCNKMSPVCFFFGLGDILLDNVVKTQGYQILAFSKN